MLWHQKVDLKGLGHFLPSDFSPLEKNANNIVDIEAGMIKQYFSS